jgi:hypothetical protein
LARRRTGRFTSTRRDAAGPDIDLMIDANCWFNPHEARLLAREIEDCNLLLDGRPIVEHGEVVEAAMAPA